MNRLPVLRPRLPSADRLLPYLRSIDGSRIYTNHGPLATELEHRLADFFRLPAGGMVCASSGTNAIVGAVLATAGRATENRPLALMPAFTFVATASAVEQCGYRPYLADIDARNWMLDPNRLIDHPLLDKVGLVVPVAPFGRPVSQEPWRVFRQKTGIPVVIDGAASFDTMLEAPERYLAEIPVALSFHATKSFATGEGGAVATTDIDLARHVIQALNFGFYGTRDSLTASTNGKMSEYHAAVGLAELDGWAAKQLTLSTVLQCYQKLARDAQVSEYLYIWPVVSNCYILCLCRTFDEAKKIQHSLEQHDVDFRFWYGFGLHHHSYFSNIERDHLEATDSLAPRLIGLPVSPDLSENNVSRVVTGVKEGVSASSYNSI